MLMHQKKFEVQIGEDTIGQSSDLSIRIPSCFLHQFQPKKQSTPPPLSSTHHSPAQPQPRTLPRLHIEIPPSSSPSSSTSSSSNFSSSGDQNESISRNQATTAKTLISTPHKRSMMSQSPSLSRSPTLSSLRQNHQQQANTEASASASSSPAAAVGSARSQAQSSLSVQPPRHYPQKTSLFKSNVSYHSFLCSPSSPVFLATKRITLKFIHHSCHASWFRVHLKFFVLMSLPSVYLLTLTRHWSFLLRFLYVLSFSALLVFALNLALPRLPSIRFFLARILCIKLSSLTPPPKHHPPVVWSIGAKPKPEKDPISGSWVQVYSNGDVYEGEFHKGKCSGSGVYYYHLSGRYEGDWINEKYDGYGVETWAKGSRYRGQYRQGLRHGVGFYRSYTGDSYSGEWCNGQCHGFGLHVCEDGSSYIGEFKLGSKHGLGHYHFRNGDTYAGEYFADKMHGFGVYQFGNGHRYEGAWHEGRRQGFGTYTFRNGETHSGHWQNGILSASSIQGSFTGSTLSVDHAKVLHAVQEARRAAEKAAELANVDERVKRAVAAANKSATAARVAAVKAVQNQMQENDEFKNVLLPDV